MEIEIWSDIMCPFCYIGKHNFEKAIAELELEREIRVVYKSYQLNPEYEYVPGDTMYSFLFRSKGMPADQVEQMTSQVSQMGLQAGVEINFGKVIPANTFDAHRLIHHAATKNVQREMKEKIFEAHFRDGKNIEDINVLIELTTELGFDAQEMRKLLLSEENSYVVNQDILEARNLGITGVPFFLMNKKYAVSGAQPKESFKQAVSKSFEDWQRG